MSKDYLIVGSGLAGSIFAHEMTKQGKKCLVIDKRKHSGGNIYTENKNDINIHVYGPHCFHCNDDNTWNYINQFATFNNYVHRVKAIAKDKIYSLPLNLMTFNQIYPHIKTPEQVKKLINNDKDYDNAEDWIINKFGKEVYYLLFHGYSTKQWNKSPREIPSSVVKRLPVRIDFNDNYFNDKYQGIPIGGYTQIIDKMLEDVECILNLDFNTLKDGWKSIAKNLVYTGSPDELYNYKFGMLEYRTLRWERETHEGNYQGTAQVNYCDLEVPYTRIIEHKHFEFNNCKHTIISKEYPCEFTKDKERLYPVEDEKNKRIYKKYAELAKRDGIILLGRLGTFKYMDMNIVVAGTRKIVENLLKKD